MKTWRTIYEAIHGPYFGEFKLFPKYFLEKYKINQNTPHNILSEIKRKIKIIALEIFFIHRWSWSVVKLQLIFFKWYQSLNKCTCFKEIYQDPRISLILILRYLNVISWQVDLSFSSGRFNAILKLNMEKKS